MKRLSYSFLIPASLLLGLAPFLPEPHLVEKIRWLFTGHPFRPIDIFDLFLHGTFPALLLVKGAGDLARRASGSAGKGVGKPPGKGSSPPPPPSRAERRRGERERKGK